MKIHIGYDEAMHEASLVCEYSIHKYAKYHLETYFLKLDELKQKGYYYREDDDSASTDFAYSRFLVPFLNNHQGWSMFVDNDFLFVTDVCTLFDYIDRDPQASNKAVYCVKHLPYQPKNETKFWGKVQHSFPRKNWSSVMIFNNSHPATKKLTPLTIANATPQWLHRFGWCKDDEIGSIDLKWNWLVGEYNDPTPDIFPRAYHYTNGGPWNGVDGQTFEKLWLDMYKEMTGLPYIT